MERRKFLKLSGVAATVGLAGCSEEEGEVDTTGNGVTDPPKMDYLCV